MSAIQTRVITEALHEAGLPPGVFNIVTGRGETVGAQISSHPDVAKLSFTGSTTVGKTILRAAADTLKRVTLELGGKSPVVVLDDANFDDVVPLAIQAGFMNSGQACIAGTRILVPQSRLAEFEARVREEVARTQVGDPRDPQTTIGPMVSQKQWERVQRYIRIGTDEGARLIAGGEGRPDGIGAGWFVRATVFSDVTNDMTIAREEIFGPVLSIIAYRDTEDAISIANDTNYGLQAYVFSADAKRARRRSKPVESSSTRSRTSRPPRSAASSNRVSVASAARLGWRLFSSRRLFSQRSDAQPKVRWARLMTKSCYQFSASSMNCGRENRQRRLTGSDANGRRIAARPAASLPYCVASCTR